MEDKTKYSYSRLECYDQCGYQYKLKYVLKKYSFAKNLSLELGTLIHETEESIANSIIKQEPINYIALKNHIILESHKLAHKYPVEYNDIDKSSRKCQEKIDDYLDHGIYRLENYLKENPQMEVVGAEISINGFKYHDYYFSGSIDRVLKNKETGKYIIQDLKTYAVPVEDKNLATPMQLMIYALAFSEKVGCDVNDIQCQYNLPFCDLVQNCGTEGYIKRGTEKIDKLFTGILSEEFEPNPTPLCAWCAYSPTNNNALRDYKYLCPYHSNWTKENKDFSKANEWQGAENDNRLVEEYKAKYGIKDKEAK